MEYERIPFVKLCPSDEAKYSAEGSTTVRLHSQEGSSHSLWMNLQAGAVEAIPRHTEIKNLLARKICRGLSIPE